MKDKKRNGFIKLEREILETAAWLAIARSGALALLVDIWGRYNGRNNGQISYSQREAERRFGCSPKRAVKWFRDLQTAGFIVAVQRGTFHQKTGTFSARATTWRLTMEPCDGEAPTREYLNFASTGESDA